jgi:hypothetical protein
MKKFTVIGFIKETGELLSYHVLANNLAHSFFMAANQTPLDEVEVEFVTSVEGHLKDGQGMGFPGKRLVNNDTVIESPLIFNTPSTQCEYPSNVIADFYIQDWRVSEQSEEDILNEHKDVYHFVIEQSEPTKQVFFKVYPKSLEGLDGDITQNGLSGVIEIRNGKPAISLGLCEDELAVHIESDLANGLYVHPESFATPIAKKFYSYSHDLAFDSAFYPCAESQWIVEAQKHVADGILANYDFGDLVVSDTGNWATDNGTWSSVVFFDNEGEDSLKGSIEIVFGEASVGVSNIEVALP